MNISDKGIALIKRFEGCRLTAYKDAVGIYTIAYGWTQPVNGKPVTRGMVINQAKADELLKYGVVQFEHGVSQQVDVAISQGQFDALVSFTYNLGLRSLSGSTLLKKLNARDFSGAADEFQKWNKAGGQILSGLVMRRAAERELFLS